MSISPLRAFVTVEGAGADRTVVQWGDTADTAGPWGRPFGAFASATFAVNSQFDARETGNPELPFNVSGVRIPGEAASEMPQTGGPNPLLLLGGASTARSVRRPAA